MNCEFNPLESRMLFRQPKRLHIKSAWNEHVPFAMLLVELQRPRVIVELGTHTGVSYCAFCQAVEELGCDTSCYAVDTWQGDTDAGYYEQDVYEELSAYHQQYASFSALLRMTFQEALSRVPDNSVDLLHIDGLHSYEAVSQDYQTWLPKLSRHGIVLFHDTAVLDRGFGVHQLWAELSAKFPHFDFAHGYGLGVLAVGLEQPDAVQAFLKTASERSEATRRLFADLGHRLQCEVDRAAASAKPPAEVPSWLRRQLAKLKV